MADVERLARELVAEQMRGIRALFRKQGARAPFLLWRPRDSDLPQRALADVKRRWQGMRQVNGIAAAGELDALLQDPLARHILVMVFEPDGGLRLTHVGREVVHDLGRDLNGERTDVFPTWIDQFLRAIARAVILRPEPIYTEHEAFDRYFVVQWDRIVLPLADDAGNVTTVLVGAVAESPVRTIINTMLDGVLALDGDDRVRLANPPAAAMFGCDPNELLGRPIRDLVNLEGAVIAAEASATAPTREAMAQRLDGSTFSVEISVGETVRKRQALKIAVLRDITKRKVSEERIRRLAFTDPLTGVANRAVFEDRFREAIARARRQRSRIALVLLDLDRFKAINDRHGHPVGDAVLRDAARRIRGVTRETDVVARLGGDEFVILQTDLASTAAARPMLARLLRSLRAPAVVGDLTLMISASIGVALYPDDAEEAATLVERADRALYAAKTRSEDGPVAFWSEVAAPATGGQPPAPNG